MGHVWHSEHFWSHCRRRATALLMVDPALRTQPPPGQHSLSHWTDLQPPVSSGALSAAGRCPRGAVPPPRRPQSPLPSEPAPGGVPRSQGCSVASCRPGRPRWGAWGAGPLASVSCLQRAPVAVPPWAADEDRRTPAARPVPPGRGRWPCPGRGGQLEEAQRTAGLSLLPTTYLRVARDGHRTPSPARSHENLATFLRGREGR